MGFISIRRRVLKWTTIILSGLLGSLLLLIGITYFQQDRIVNEVISILNRDFSGRVELADSHISPFKQFPYISIDLENLEIFEGKGVSSEIILHVNDAYLGFDIWSILNGSYAIRRVDLSQGFMRLVQHTDGSFNIANALSSKADTIVDNTDSEGFNLDLQSIKLTNIDLIKINEANNVVAEAYINTASSRYRSSDIGTEVTLTTDLLFNLVVDNDTSFLHDKHLTFETALQYRPQDQILEIFASEVLLENAQFLFEGTIDIDDDMNLDLHFEGLKPSFDLFLAFVPEELSPLFSRYDNGGNVYFDATVQGPSINGNNPQIEVDFGASRAYVHNKTAGKEVNDLNFKGHFTNGNLRNASTMSLTIQDFSARPETGEFEGEVTVSNFDSPDIDMKVISDFDLDFLAGFLNLTNLKDITGEISLELNFHDIIDLSQPEKSIERLNESYFTRLQVKNLNFRDTGYALPVRDVNILAVMDGHEASIDQLDFKIGSSDIAIKAGISDLPAILHHTNIPVNVRLDIRSNLIDLGELTGSVEDTISGFEEQIKDLNLSMSFISSAKAFTESAYLPVGEFFINELDASFTNYPHRLHDFRADMFIDESDFRVIDFTGMIDQSDFHFNGVLENYDLWFAENPTGSTRIDFNLSSALISLQDIFTYGGQNYVPEDYRHEEFRDLLLHGVADLNFSDKLTSSQISIDQLEASMKIHPMRFEQFSGDFYLDSTQLIVSGFGGKLGNTEFSTDLSYYYEPDSTQQHTFSLIAQKLDFDQLFLYNPPPEVNEPVDHDEGFNVFELPFANMAVEIKIDQLNYHRYLLTDIEMAGRMQKDHYLFVDTLHLNAAGGSMDMNGYFNGSDPTAIYFSPEMNVSGIDLDKLMFKFENFGQDELVSDNLHGKLTGTVSGRVHMHTDMVPSIDDSELHIDFSVVNGSLNHFAPFDALSNYFTDKNLANVRFDTLRNDLYLKNGVLTIPNMKINSTLGYFELSGKQNTNLEMVYNMRIPIKVVTKAAFQRLFSKKGEDNSTQVDDIQYRDETKRIRFVNIKIEGNPDDYSISLGDN